MRQWTNHRRDYRSLAVVHYGWFATRRSNSREGGKMSLALRKTVPGSVSLWRGEIIWLSFGEWHRRHRLRSALAVWFVPSHPGAAAAFVRPPSRFCCGLQKKQERSFRLAAMMNVAASHKLDFISLLMCEWVIFPCEDSSECLVVMNNLMLIKWLEMWETCCVDLIKSWFTQHPRWSSTQGARGSDRTVTRTRDR